MLQMRNPSQNKLRQVLCSRAKEQRSPECGTVLRGDSCPLAPAQEQGPAAAAPDEPGQEQPEGERLDFGAIRGPLRPHEGL